MNGLGYLCMGMGSVFGVMGVIWLCTMVLGKLFAE